MVNSGGMRKDIASVAAEVGRIEQKAAANSRNLFDAIDSLDDVLDLLEKFLPPKEGPSNRIVDECFL